MLIIVLLLALTSLGVLIGTLDLKSKQLKRLSYASNFEFLVLHLRKEDGRGANSFFLFYF